jgi:flagellar transcriptional activator FlhD
MDALVENKELADRNLAWLLMAQRMLREDRAAARRRLGLGVAMADVLVDLSLADTMKLATSNIAACALRPVIA